MRISTFIETLKFRILIAYYESCQNLSMQETLEFLALYAEELWEKNFPENTRYKNYFCSEEKIKDILFRDKYGSNAIPVRIALLRANGFPNFDTMTAKEHEEMEIFNQRWDEMFGE